LDPAPAPTTTTATATTDPTPADTVTTTTTVAAAGPATSFVAPVTDADGYRFDVSVNLAVSDLGDTVEHDKPGFMSAYFSLNLDMEITNRTPGRTIEFEQVAGVTAPLSYPKFLVSALWETGTPVCRAAAVADEPCAMVLGFGYANSPLEPDATLALDTYEGRPGGGFTAGLAAFPETAWPQLQTALTAPDRYLVSYDGGDYQRFDCALNMQLGIVVAASTGALDCTDVPVTMVQQPQTL
jgi:hypothetical protein